MADSLLNCCQTSFTGKSFGNVAVSWQYLIFNKVNTWTSSVHLWSTTLFKHSLLTKVVDVVTFIGVKTSQSSPG